MYVDLNPSSATWHFKRAARKSDGTTCSQWKPHLEGTRVCGVQAAGTTECLGFSDPRLDTWMHVHTMPSDPFLLLQPLGVLPDPALDFNEDAVQWVGETDWVFRCVFKTPEDLDTSHSLDLLVDGLDTVATVWLNDNQVHASQNGFMSYRISLTKHARKKKGDGNVLMFHFMSAFREGRKLELHHGKRACWNGDSSRVYVRKPQYHYGWDWGPTLLTCGIIGIPRLHSFVYRLEDVAIQPLMEKEKKNILQVSCDISGPEGPLVLDELQNLNSDRPDLRLKVGIECKDEHWQYTFGDPDSSGIFSYEVKEIHTHQAIHCDQTPTQSHGSRPIARLQISAALPSVRLWTLGSGAKESLYTVRIVLWDAHNTTQAELETVEKRTGFRHVELIQEPFQSQSGMSFYFRFNDQPVFLAGSNWIPASSYPTRVTKEDYRELLTLLAQGGQNAIRVWGGGYYEHEDFYDLCDELGILVWQDFMFACAAYPADLPAFRENVRQEAIHTVKRLAHHPCLALFAGNNEDYQIAEAERLEWDPSNNRPKDWLNGTFPARYIYEKLLPETVSHYSNTAYHPGSPWKTGGDTRNPTKGDIHQWNVWHGTQENYQDWDKLGGRFVSEFGMHALPDRRTVDGFTGSGKRDNDLQSRVLDKHNKATGGITRLSQYMIKNLKYTMELDDYIYASQLMQADCLSTAYQVWRREWKGAGKRYCGGALVWQLNDVYPSISWSIIDFYRRPKLAYYAIKRVLEPLTINLKRVKKVSQPDPLSAKQNEETELHLWIANSSLESYIGRIEICTMAIETGFSDTLHMPCEVHPNGSTEICMLKMDQASEQDVVVIARLYLQDHLQAETFSWPDPLRFIKPNHARVTFSFNESDRTVTVRTDKPVKGVTFSFDADVILDDNGFDLVPGRERKVRVADIPGRKGQEKIRTPTCRWYNQG